MNDKIKEGTAECQIYGDKQFSPILVSGPSKGMRKDTEFTITGDGGPEYLVTHIVRGAGKHSLTPPWGGEEITFDPKTGDFVGEAKNATAVLMGNSWRIEVKR